jgi:hypothetical protein
MRDAAMPGLQRGETSLSIPEEVEVSASVLDMSMSLDGSIADPNGFLGEHPPVRLRGWVDPQAAGPGSAMTRMPPPTSVFRPDEN